MIDDNNLDKLLVLAQDIRIVQLDLLNTIVEDGEADDSVLAMAKRASDAWKQFNDVHKELSQGVNCGKMGK